MKVFICLALLLPAIALAQTEEQILYVTSGDSVGYVFGYKKVTVDLSRIPKADRDYIYGHFWAADLTDGRHTQVKICSRDSTEQAAIMGQLQPFGLVPTPADISLTAQQKADARNSGIFDKGKLVRYLRACAAIRAARTITDSVTVRAVAKGGL